MAERLRDRLRDRLSEAATDLTGLKVVDSERLQLMESLSSETGALRRELDAIAWTALDYVGGKPQELKAVERRRLIQKARIVWMKDPQAGAAIDLMNDFVIGSGLPKPKANDAAVQEVVDEAWADPDNQLVLTSTDAQVALGTDLEIQPLDPSTSIRMADGTSKVLRDVVVGDAVVTHTGQVARVARNVDAGVQPRFRLTTVEGREVIGAGTHPFLTVDRGWQQLAELEEDDRLVREPQIEGLVATVSAEEARLMGYFIGDGAISGSNASFINADAETVADFTACAEAQGWRVTAEGYGLYCHGVSGGVRPWLRRHGMSGHTAPKKRVPEAIMRGPNALVEEFLRAYFAADGCAHVRDHDGALFFTTTSRGLADDVLHLLGRLGMRGRIRLWQPASAKRPRDTWQVFVRVQDQPVFLERVRPLSYKNERLRDAIDRRVEKQAQSERAVAVATAKAALAEHDRVVSVEPLEPGPVRCLSIDHDDHSYVANGIVTHNSNVFLLVFADGDDGKVKLSVLEHDSVENVVRDPDNRLRIMYYVARYFEQHWDFANDRPMMNFGNVGSGTGAAQSQRVGNTPVSSDAPATKLAPTMGAPDAMKGAKGQGEIRYFEHWRNVDLAREEAEEGARDARTIPLAPDPKLGDGKVFSISINRTMEMAFGHPRMDRLLRWYNAYNRFIDARMDIIEASAAFVMKRQVKGTPQQLQKMATQALSRRGVLGSTIIDATGEERQVGPRPASVLVENDAITHEPFNIDTRAGNAMQDSQMIRAQVSAGTRWPQSYFGDSSNANLATATSLELPVLKAVETRQEKVEQTVRFFVDRTIERAVETGRISKTLTAAERAKQQKTAKDTNPMAGYEFGPALISEDYEDQGADEQQTERDLGYEFSMPSPLKRMMSDLIAGIQSVAQTFDPNNTNMELSRTLLTIALGEALELEDPAGAVEKIFPPGYVDPAVLAAQQQAQQGPTDALEPRGDGASAFGEFGPGAPGAPGADGDRHSAGNPYGTAQNSMGPDNPYGMMQAAVTAGRDGAPVVWGGRRRPSMALSESRKITGDLAARQAVRNAGIGQEFDLALEQILNSNGKAA